MASTFVDNEGVKIHLITNDIKGGPTLLMVPGMFGVAEHWGDEFAALDEYSLCALSIRGRGKSSAPSCGYSFEDQTSDIVAVMDFLESDQIVFCAHSFGCLLAISAAHQRAARVAGLILIDYGLTAKKVSEKWLDRVRKVPPATSSLEVAEKIAAQSRDIDLTREFLNLKIPKLIFKGAAEGHFLSETAAQALSKMPNTKIILMKNSGHYPTGEDNNQFIKSIKSHLKALP